MAKWIDFSPFSTGSAPIQILQNVPGRTQIWKLPATIFQVETIVTAGIKGTVPLSKKHPVPTVLRVEKHWSQWMGYLPYQMVQDFIQWTACLVFLENDMRMISKSISKNKAVFYYHLQLLCKFSRRDYHGAGTVMPAPFFPHLCTTFLRFRSNCFHLVQWKERKSMMEKN